MDPSAAAVTAIIANCRRSRGVRKLYNFYIDPDLAEGLKKLKEARQRSEGQIVRDALREYLERKGVMKSERKRAASRKRS